jgi:hypothetical protein
MYEQPNSPFKKQKLSRAAAKRKAERDLAYAKTPDRRKKKADSQRRRRRAEAEGRNVAGMDFDHKDGIFKSIRKNRGNDGKGTKREGNSNYNVA